jgi:hypothetical protein
MGIGNVHMHKMPALHAVDDMQQQANTIQIDLTRGIIPNDWCGHFPALSIMVAINPLCRHLLCDLSDGVSIDVRDLIERYHEFGSLATSGTITRQNEIVHGKITTFLRCEFIRIDLRDTDAYRSPWLTSAPDHVVSDFVNGFSIAIEDKISHDGSFLQKSGFQICTICVT